MQVGSLVRIKYSNSAKMVGKMAIVLKQYYMNVTIYIIDDERKEIYAQKKLEVLCK